MTIQTGRISAVLPATSLPKPNPEGRNPKEGRIPKAEAKLEHFGFRVSAFFRPSDFRFRVWAFALTAWWCCPDTPLPASGPSFCLRPVERRTRLGHAPPQLE
jgi:hypothetical protein